VDYLILDIAVRGFATGVCVVLTTLIWMSRIARDAQISITLVTLFTVLKLWSTVAPTIGLPDHILPAMRVLIAGSSFAMTWFVLTIFLDDRRSVVLWLGSGLAIWVAILSTPIWPDIIAYLRAYAIVHFATLLVLVVYSGIGDLQDARRRLRPIMSAFLLFYCLGRALTSRPLQDVRTIDLQLGQASVFLFFITIFALWSLKANLNTWPGKIEPTRTGQPSPTEVSFEQNALVTRLQAEMDGGVWRTEGLTVAALAQKVGVPEHQVRKAINQVLGHRNFASFINAARIDAAKVRLIDQDAQGETILEIAFDVGFSSLGPFNRAFRDATGMSPTDYRKQRLAVPLA